MSVLISAYLPSPPRCVRAPKGLFAHSNQNSKWRLSLSDRCPQLFKMKRKSVSVPFAVGSCEGEARFVVSGYRSAASTLHGIGRIGRNKNDRVRAVPIQTIDSLARSLRAPTIINIDVEGAENLVWRALMA